MKYSDKTIETTDKLVIHIAQSFSHMDKEGDNALSIKVKENRATEKDMKYIDRAIKFLIDNKNIVIKDIK